MLRILKRLLLPLAMVAMTQTSLVNAESIRLIGPNGEVQTSPQFAEPINRSASESSEPSRFYGPTSDNDTLWSIASRLRPAANLSVQQTLLAIYRLNPKAFEEQNIHSLIPGSVLRIPSLAQVRGVSTQEAVRIMEAHQARLNQQQAPATPQPVEPVAKLQPATPVKPLTAEKVESNRQSVKVDDAQTADSQASSASQPTADKPSAKPVPVAPAAQENAANQVPKLAEPQNNSETELLALEEKNHKLRLMLSEVQSEVEVLKGELSDENRIRSEVEKLLAEERARQVQEQQLAPTTLDKILSNGWSLAALASIPGLFIVALGLWLFSRRSRKSEQETAEAPQAETQSVADPMMAAGLAHAIDDDIEDDLLLDDDLFGELDDESDELIDLEDDEPAADQNDIFADLDSSELDFNLEDENGDDPFASIGDDGDLDTDLAELGADLTELDTSTTDISVSGDEKALGLEEMERALEQAVSEDDSDGGDFDLSDEGALSQEDIESLLAGEFEDSEPLAEDQQAAEQVSELDLSSAADELDEFDFDLSDESDNEPSVASVDQDNASELDNTDIDDLFEQFAQPTQPQSESETLLDDMLDDEPLPDENSTDLLDEWIDRELTQTDREPASLEDEFEQLIGLDDTQAEEPQAATTENADKLSIDDSLFDEQPLVDENSTELLDELLDDDEPEQDGEDLFAQSLDELFDSQHASETDQLDQEPLDDDSLALFDELLSIDSEEAQDQPLAATDSPLDQADDEQQAYSSQAFIDDLINSVPESDSLPDQAQSESQPESSAEQGNVETVADAQESDDDWLSEAIAQIEQADETSLFEESPEDSVQQAVQEPDELSDERFDFAPQVEGAEQDFADADVETDLADAFASDPEVSTGASPAETVADLADEQQSDSLHSAHEAPATENKPEPAANEFGTPLDDDWLVDDDQLQQINQLLDGEASVSNDFGAETAESSELSLDEAAVAASVSAEQSDDELDIDLSQLPEYSEQDALADLAREPVEVDNEPVEVAGPQAEVADDELEIDLSELPEYGEQDALADMGLESVDDKLPEEVEPQAQSASPAEAADDELEIDLSELPEYDEQEALAAMANEPATTDSEALPASSDDLDYDIDDLPEYGEEDAQADMPSETGELQDFNLSPVDIPTMEETFGTEDLSSEQDALHAAFQFAADTDKPSGFDEQSIDSMLEEAEDAKPAIDIQGQLDQTIADSAGMDLDAMLDVGGEDWNGFTLSPEQQAQIPDEIPAEEAKVWDESNPIAAAMDENWADQELLADFDPKSNQLRTIEELMAEMEGQDLDHEEQEILNLDVGLNEFPDVIGQVGETDVDANAEAAGKLDLAKIYMEMNDSDGAKKLLESAIVDGSDDIRRQAKRLIDEINAN
ncbi:FimV/HubP family polar landmark protein [Vibrio sp.]|uniref:FimV/HubP family polar landmark protein n=1 Tax=Vibrio sp. TaxID=678 RepID=UPI003D0F917B